MRVIKCSSISNAYDKAVLNILNNGVMKHIHGTDVLQSDPCALEIKINNDNDENNKAPLKRNATEVYKNDFLNPDKGEQPYTYGERLCAYPASPNAMLNQLQYIITELSNDPTSRQAVGIIWNPLYDQISENPPCFQYIQAFENTRNELELFFLFRSNDWYQALLQNLIGLKLVCNTISTAINKPITTMNLTAVCPHIYWHNIETCKLLWNYKELKYT